MDAIEALKTRRSVRAFTGEPVSREMIEEIVDCGRLAASARNRQPWEFVVVTDKQKLCQLAAATQDTGKYIADAAVCVVVLGNGEDAYYVEGCSNAAHNMLLAAHALGLGGCWNQTDRRPWAEDVRQLIGAPEGQKPLCMLGIGHSMGLPDKPKRELSEVLHWEKF
jgi:nitroreductase